MNINTRKYYKNSRFKDITRFVLFIDWQIIDY